MATKVASIIAEIGLDSRKFESGSRGVSSGLSEMVTGFLSVTAVASTAVAIMTEVVSQMKAAEEAAAESAQAEAKLTAVLSATGGAAGMTASALNGLAEQISKTAGLDDELVMSSEAVLLTFTRIGKEVFPATMQAAADMAAVMGGDLQGTIVQVGKAMNDFAGYTALKRAGVSFTEEQIKQIAYFKETNDLAGYQKLVLSELSKEFGGAAQAMNKAGDGAANMEVSLGNLQEALGRGLLPQVRDFKNSVTDIADTISDVVNKQNDWNDRVRAAGVEIGHFNTYTKDGISITAEMADELASNAQVAENMSRSYQLMGEAILATGVSAGMTEADLAALEEQEKQLTETNQTMIQMTASFQSAEESYQAKNKSLTEERIKLEEERATKLRQGYSESGNVVKGLTDKLSENARKASENASSHELAGRRIILGYLEQKLAMDGLSTEETNFLLEKGAEWGVYSKTAISAMKDAMIEAETLATKIKNIPGSKTITITTNYVRNNVTNNTINTSVNSVSGYNADLLSGLGHSEGANFVVPPGYPNDSYPMRVESGEHVVVTPAGRDSNSVPATQSSEPPGTNVVFYGNVTFQVQNEQDLSGLMQSLSRA